MSMFPHTVTLYNTRAEPDKTTFEDVTTNNITILRGVLLDASKAANVRASGLEGADAANLYIPFDVEAIDPADIGVEHPPIKKYIGQIEFWRMDEDEQAKHWTLSTNKETWFAKGIALAPEGTKPQNVYDNIISTHDDVYEVTKVDVKDFGGLQHFEVGAN